MTKIIAEIANAHQGSVENAISLAKASLETGADLVKFQIYFGDEFLVPSHPRYDHFCNQAFSDKEWKSIFDEFCDQKSRIVTDIFGERAFDLAIEHGIKNIKIINDEIVILHNSNENSVSRSSDNFEWEIINYYKNTISIEKIGDMTFYGSSTNGLSKRTKGINEIVNYTTGNTQNILDTNYNISNNYKTVLILFF